MKNYLVVGLYPNEICPAFTLSLAKSLKIIGANVYAILPENIENIEEWEKEFDEDKLCFLKIEKKNFLDKYINVFLFLLLRKKYLGCLEKIHFDCVFFSFFHSWNSLIIKIIRSSCFASFLHDPKLHSGESSKREIRLVNQMKKMDKLIVLSEKFVEYTVKSYRKTPNDVIYMPLCLFYGTRELKDVDIYLDDCAPVNFLFFGRITEYKGMQILIRAFKMLENDNQNAYLTIAGNGDFSPYQSEFKELKSTRLINRYISDDEIDTLFKQKNSVVVVPYLDATQSGVVSLAYSFGNPVIASDTGGLKEQLDNGKVGLFCEPGNSFELFTNMKKICENRQLLKSESYKMIKHSYNYDWKIATQKLLIDLKLS